MRIEVKPYPFGVEVTLVHSKGNPSGAQTIFYVEYCQWFHFQRTISDVQLPNSKNREYYTQLQFRHDDSLRVLTVTFSLVLSYIDKMYSPLCFVDNSPILFSTYVHHHRVSSKYFCPSDSIYSSQKVQHLNVDGWWCEHLYYPVDRLYTQNFGHILNPQSMMISPLQYLPTDVGPDFRLLRPVRVFSKKTKKRKSLVERSEAVGGSHFETQLLWIKPSLSTIMCNFIHPLLLFFLLDQGSSPWIDKPVLSTMRWGRSSFDSDT